MSKEIFVTREFRPKTLAMIDQADAILNEYARQGFVLTLRQLFYQFVSRLLIENKQTEYNRLGETLVNARRAGLVDWCHIEDRTRSLETYTSWNSPAALLRPVAEWSLF